MQSICHLSRRWHQQFYRSPSFSGHRRCLRQWRSSPAQRIANVRRETEHHEETPSLEQSSTEANEARPPQNAQEWENRPPRDTPNVVVREYEQIIGKPHTRRLEQDPFEEGAKAIRKKIKTLERELAISRKGPFARESEFMQQLPEDQREELLKGMEEAGLEDGFELPEVNFDEFLTDRPTGDLAVTLRIPVADRAYVRKFNDALKTTDDKSKRNLWIWYLRCQQKVPTFSTFISDDVWDHLWKTQLDIHPRSKHIVVLARDMEAAGVAFRQHFGDYLDALHHIGETSTALRLWEKERRPPKVGVQLYAAVGRVSSAEEIALSHLEPDTILPVIKAWAESKDPDAAQRLWSFYQKITPSVDLLGRITSILLKAQRQDIALAVFRDMLGKGAEFKGLDVNEFGLKAVLRLPPKFKNKFFFGAWIRWLLAERKVEDATTVVELMLKKGVKPDARHLNGIIAACLRRGYRNDWFKAQQIAWAMIEERVRMVKSRGRSTTNADDKLLQDSDLNHHLPRLLRQNMPAASIETFSILIQRYTRQSDIEKAANLTRIMTGPAEIKPNSFILNHWLYLFLRASDPERMWRHFEEVQTLPDLETFVVLWDGERRSLSTPGSHKRVFPPPRELYKIMTSWLATLSDTQVAETQGRVAPSFYEQIVRCFCLNNDLPGASLAMRHMHENFDMLPHEEIASMFVMQAARMTSGEITPGPQSQTMARRQREETYRAAIGNFTEFMQQIMYENVRRAQAKGMKIDIFGARESPAVQALRFEAIQTFLYLVMFRLAKKAHQVQNAVFQAGQDMGVRVEQETAKKLLEHAVKILEDDDKKASTLEKQKTPQKTPKKTRQENSQEKAQKRLQRKQQKQQKKQQEQQGEVSEKTQTPQKKG